MPLCVGICVLLAIVYVLSRTGDRDALLENTGGNPHMRANAPPQVPNAGASAPVPSGPSASSYQSSSYQTSSYQTAPVVYGGQQQQQSAYQPPPNVIQTVPNNVYPSNSGSGGTSNFANPQEPCNCPPAATTNQDPHELMAAMRAEALAKSS